ncbi:MAG: hypothetical protein ACLP07_01905 [Terracidiphilus sp.]
MNWRPILTHAAWALALAVVVEAGAICACSHWFWTPIQRHYLAAYVWCSLPVITPASAEVRFIWKTGRHRKRELATEDDVDSQGATDLKLSQSALDAGWRGLTEEPPREVPAPILKRGLADLAFEGESLWSFLLLPEACGLVAFGYALYGFVRLANRFADCIVERSLRRQRSWWKEPSWSPLDWCAEKAQKLCSCAVALHRRAQHCIEQHRAETNHSIALSEPEASPPSFAIPIFGVYSGTGEGYLLREKDEIE